MRLYILVGLGVGLCGAALPSEYADFSPCEQCSLRCAEQKAIFYQSLKKFAESERSWQESFERFKNDTKDLTADSKAPKEDFSDICFMESIIEIIDQANDFANNPNTAKKEELEQLISWYGDEVDQIIQKALESGELKPTSDK